MTETTTMRTAVVIFCSQHVTGLSILPPAGGAALAALFPFPPPLFPPLCFIGAQKGEGSVRLRAGYVEGIRSRRDAGGL